MTDLRSEVNDFMGWCNETAQIYDPDSSKDFNDGWREGVLSASREAAHRHGQWYSSSLHKKALALFGELAGAVRKALGMSND